jgi:multidrug efflux system membrane fusion protein
MPMAFFLAHHPVAGHIRLLALCGIAAAAGACSAGSASPQQTSRPPAAVPVTVAPVMRKAMPKQIAVIGNVEPYTTVAVRAQVQGELTGVHFREGQDVRKGDLLFTIDPRPFQAALQQAEANLAKDRAQLANAQAQVQRYEDLLKRGIATREQVDQIVSNASALNAAVKADEALVENARLQLQYTTIRAPISGRTGALMVHQGNLVKANDTTPLVTINQVTPIYVGFAVPEQWLPELKKYEAAHTLKIDAAPPNEVGPPAAGSISFMDNAVDPATGTIRVKGMFPNRDRRLWPGQFVNVVLTLTTEPNAVVVPSQAVQTGQQGQYVFVVKPDRTVDSRPVAVERTVGGESVIARGLEPGEEVVTDGQLRLVPGAKIEIKNAPQGGKGPAQ